MKRALVSAGIGGAVGAAAASALLRGPLPKIRGEVKVPGLDGPIAIDRDASGVPHIRASSDHDAFFAQGWCLAQDRMWQMETFRRLCFGTISELAGPVGLETDRFMRRLGMKSIAERVLAAMSDESRGVLQAYADGFNTYLRLFPRRIPIEFRLVRSRPQPWEPIASIAFFRYIGWNLTGVHDRILAFGKCAEALPPDMFKALFGAEAAASVVPSALHPDAEADVIRQARDAQAAASAFGGQRSGSGSNAWAVAGDKTKSGKPLLASDPHLMLAMPSLWYELSIDSPGFEATGACLPGVPGVVIGRNRNSAWGVTSTMLVSSDLYAEELHPSDPSRYRAGDDWLPFEDQRQTIVIRGRPSEQIVVRQTRHGPLISDVNPGDRTALALRWAGAEVGDDVRALLGVGRAATWREFRDALRHLVTPSLNCLYADASGTIGYQLAGRYPVREGGGVAPVDGATATEWQGFIPFDALPMSVNPPTGIIASANTRMIGADYPFELTGMWEPPYRLERITELLDGRSQLSLDDMRAMQSDVCSLRARRLLPRLLTALERSRDPDLCWALAQLRDWEGELATVSVAATLFEVWYTHCFDRILGLGLDADQRAAVREAAKPGWGDSILRWLESRIVEGDSAWFHDVEPDQVLRAAMSDTIRWLTTKFDSRRDRWTWGRLHAVTFEHPLGVIAPLRPLLNRGPYSMDGGTVTLSSAVYDVAKSYAPKIVASYRQLVNLAEPEQSLSATPSGQSGHPASSHYADQCRGWLRHGYHPLMLDSEQVKRHSVAHLRLEPA